MIVGFDKYYKKNLEADFRSIEKTRHRYLGVFFLVLLFVCLFPFFAVSYFSIDAGAAFVYVSLAFFVLNAPIFFYKKKSKINLMPKILDFFCQSQYYFQRTFDDDLIVRSNLFKEYNEHKGDDFFECLYKDVQIDIAEAQMAFWTTDGKRDFKQKTFSGIIVLVDMNKSFSGQTMIYKDKGLLNFTQNFSGYQKVRLEDVNFEKNWEVYSTDQVEARYLITPSFMLRLLNLRQTFGSKNLECSFFDNRLMLAIGYDKNFFELSSLFRTAGAVRDVDRVCGQIAAILGIVDELKLNQRLWG